jgi:hypothetical protein
MTTRIGNMFRALFERMFGDAHRASFPEHYVRTLEEEVARLRAENRALLNSLLGTAGIPPLEIPGGPATRPAAMPTRRRSWPQIAQSLEANSRAAATTRNAATAASSHVAMPQNAVAPRANSR